MLTVFESKFANGWPDHEAGAPAYQVSIGRALRRAYKTDSHCAAYVSPLLRRLNTGAVGRADVTMTYAIVDVDCPDTHGSSEPAPDSWRRAELEKVHTLNAEHPGVFAADSRGGYRLFYVLPEPAELHTPDDVFGWSRFYRIKLAYLERRFGIVGDPACSDFTRFYRMPHATRDPKSGPERRATFGDPDAIGVFLFEPTDDDVRKAVQSAKPAPTRTLNFSCSAAGDGLLFYLLDANGDIGPEVQRQGKTVRIVRCPNRTKHTASSDWTNSTIWFPPAAGKEIGAIACQHAHCKDFTIRDWLGLYSDTEKDAARERAGISMGRSRAA